jgi:hypothetical protein
MRRLGPEHVLKNLVVLFNFSAIMFAVLGLLTPPEALTSVSGYFGRAYAASIIWPDAMSIGVACFGANAHAALKALSNLKPSRS